MNIENYQNSYNNSKLASSFNDINPPTSLPLFLKNAYVAGVKESVFGIILLLIWTVGAIYFNLKNYSIFYHYVFDLILFFPVIIILAIFRSNVEINSKYIRTSTIFQWILGSRTHTLDSINTIKVKKNEFHRLAYWSLLIVGTLWLFLLLAAIFGGKAPTELIHSFFGIFFCFGYGYFIQIESKSVYHIMIHFDPNPSINHLTIYTRDVQQIADMIEKASRDSGNGAVGDGT